jgi:UrcA family protein
MKRLTMVAVAAAALLPAAVNAQAPLRTERVSLADIRNTPQSLRIAESRIEAAAQRVCEAGDERLLDVKALEAECAAEAKDAAMAKLDRRVPAGPAVSVKVAGVRAGTVSLRDLDLAQPEAQRAAEHRIAFAARQACDIGDRQDLRMKRLEAECAVEAVRIARADLQRATLLAVRGGSQLRAAR